MQFKQKTEEVMERAMQLSERRAGQKNSNCEGLEERLGSAYLEIRRPE